MKNRKFKLKNTKHPNFRMNGEGEINFDDFHPVFSFVNVASIKDEDFSLSDKNNDLNKSLLDRLTILSSISWKEIKKLNKKNGFEPIDIKKFKNSDWFKQKFPNIDVVMVAKIEKNDTSRIIGVRDKKYGQIFNILVLDKKGILYDH